MPAILTGRLFGLVLSLLALAQAATSIAQTVSANAIAWPQQFELYEGEPVSYGIAVTRPGLVRVVVQSQGVPVSVSLVGPQRVERTGAGQVVLEYSVTPADVQAGSLWTVRVLPQPTAQKSRLRTVGNGSITVQSPPPDIAVAEARFNSVLVPRRAGLAGPDDRVRVAIERDLTRSRTQLSQQQDSIRAAAEARGGAALDRMKGNTQIRSRGMAGPSADGSAPIANPSQKEISSGRVSRAENPGLVLKPIPGTPQPPAPPPQITRTDSPSGLPRQMMVIEGTSFGAGGDVLYLLNPGVEVPGVVVGWNDTMIAVRVPDATGVGPFRNGGIAVVRSDQARSNSAAFEFIPELEQRQVIEGSEFAISMPGAAQIHRVTKVARSVYHGPYDFWQCFSGNRNSDVLFPSVRLKNGWIVEWAQVYPSIGMSMVGGNAWVTESRPGTDSLLTRVRWWYDAFTDLQYQFVVQIRGPRGMPDGAVIP